MVIIFLLSSVLQSCRVKVSHPNRHNQRHHSFIQQCELGLQGLLLPHSSKEIILTRHQPFLWRLILTPSFNSVKSSQELELEELEKAPKFRAKPLNKKVWSLSWKHIDFIRLWIGASVLGFILYRFLRARETLVCLHIWNLKWQLPRSFIFLPMFVWALLQSLICSIRLLSKVISCYSRSTVFWSMCFSDHIKFFPVLQLSLHSDCSSNSNRQDVPRLTKPNPFNLHTEVCELWTFEAFMAFLIVFATTK